QVITESRTTSQLISFAHRWTIDNFSFQCGFPELQVSSELISLESVSFSPPNNSGIKFSLILYPYGCDMFTPFYDVSSIKSSEYMDLYLSMVMDRYLSMDMDLYLSMHFNKEF